MKTDALPCHPAVAASQAAIIDQTRPWLLHLAATGRSPRTVETYLAAVRNLAAFLETRARTHLKEVRAADLEAWQQHLVGAGCRPASVELFVGVARRMFRWFAKTGRIFTDPATGLIAPKIPRPLGQCPTEEEMRRLLDGQWRSGALGQRDRAILELAYATGARLDELVRLDVTTIDHGTGTVRLRGKGGRDRMVPLTTSASEAVACYLSGSRPRLIKSATTEALFLSSRGGRRLESFAVASAIKRQACRCGLHVTPHAIRRAFATHLLRGGAHVAEVKDLLGHQGYRHLRHYLRLHPKQVVDVVRNQRLGRR